MEEFKAKPHNWNAIKISSYIFLPYKITNHEINYKDLYDYNIINYLIEILYLF